MGGVRRCKRLSKVLGAASSGDGGDSSGEGGSGESGCAYIHVRYRTRFRARVTRANAQSGGKQSEHDLEHRQPLQRASNPVTRETVRRGVVRNCGEALQRTEIGGMEGGREPERDGGLGGGGEEQAQRQMEKRQRYRELRWSFAPPHAVRFLEAASEFSARPTSAMRRRTFGSRTSTTPLHPSHRCSPCTSIACAVVCLSSSLKLSAESDRVRADCSN